MFKKRFPEAEKPMTNVKFSYLTAKNAGLVGWNLIVSLGFYLLNERKRLLSRSVPTDRITIKPT